MRKTSLLSTTLLVTTVISAQTHAANIYFNATSGDWGTATNWVDSGMHNVLPGSADQAIIPAGLTATVNSNVGSVSVFLTGGPTTAGGISGTGAGEVDIVAGGSITAVTGGAQRNANGTTSILKMSGGTLTITNLFEVGNSASTNNATATISGGALAISGTGGMHIGVDTAGQGKGLMIVSGQSSTITSSTNLQVHSSGTLDFQLDSAGVSAINLTGSATAAFSGGSTLIIDGTQYTGGSGAFTLVTGGAGYSNNGVNIQYVGFNPNWTVNTVVGPSSVTLNVTAVPEAASIGLLGLSGLALLLRHSRR